LIPPTEQVKKNSGRRIYLAGFRLVVEAAQRIAGAGQKRPLRNGRFFSST
jgi:hypothetical protein